RREMSRPVRDRRLGERLAGLEEVTVPGSECREGVGQRSGALDPNAAGIDAVFAQHGQQALPRRGRLRKVDHRRADEIGPREMRPWLAREEKESVAGVDL